MREKLLKIISSHFPESDNNKKNWQYVLDNCSIVPSCFYLQSMVEYYVSYYSKKDAINISFVLYDHKDPGGVMPLIARTNEDREWILSSNGSEILEPIFSKALARKAKKRITKELKFFIYDLAKKLNIKKCQFANMSLLTLSNWYLMWAEIAKKNFSTHHICVDLSLSLEDIRLEFRKSFKPLINKGLREWKVQIYEKVSNEIFESFRMLHKSVAGRTTRSIESWQIQKEQINAGEAFLVTVVNEEDTLVGGGLFTYSRDNAFYCVGAYKRELSDKPLGHIVQMKAIETLKKNKVKWYEIGAKHLKTDGKIPTKKQLLIAHFTEGFETNIIVRQHLIVDLNYN